MKPRIRTLLKAQREALRKAPPKSRDRIRHRVKVLEVAELLKRKGRIA